MAESRNWSAQEVEYLIEHKDQPFKVIAKALGRTERAVAMKVTHLKNKDDGLNLHKRQRVIELTPIQEDFLLENYKNCSIPQLMAILGIGKNSVTKQAKILGLVKGTKKVPSRVPKIQAICRNAECNNTFERRPKDIESNTNIYCSRTCQGEDYHALSKSDELKLIKLYKYEHKTGVELAEIFGIHSSTVYAILHNYNVKLRPTNSSGKNCLYKGINFRSMWEMAYAKWLDKHKIIWQYEPRRFEYDKIKTGTQSYLPDFYLPEYINPYTKIVGTWVEIKGYLRPRGKTGIRRFKIYYPEEFKQLMYISSKGNRVTNEFFQSLQVPSFALIEDIMKEII